MTGLWAALNNLTAASTAAVWGAGGNEGGELIDPQEIRLGLIGEKRTSIGKSRRTGPKRKYISNCCQKNQTVDDYVPGDPD
jgi:hypothetical protein